MHKRLSSSEHKHLLSIVKYHPYPDHHLRRSLLFLLQHQSDPYAVETDHIRGHKQSRTVNGEGGPLVILIMQSAWRVSMIIVTILILVFPVMQRHQRMARGQHVQAQMTVRLSPSVAP